VSNHIKIQLLKRAVPLKPVYLKHTVQTDEVPTDLSVLTVMLWIQVLCDVTLRRHFIRLLYPEDEAIGNLQTPHKT
jgi:hypothetical protein